MGIKLLLADDHKLVREGLRSLIEDEPDMTVIAEVDNGLSAVETTTQLQPDVVIMDISMPKLSGIDATRQIRSSNAHSRVIALSIHLTRRLILDMIDAGASGYLLKDCAFEDLTCAIRAIAANNTYFSPQLSDFISPHLRLLQQHRAPRQQPSGDGDARRLHDAPDREMLKDETADLPTILKPREKDILFWVHEGKSNWEISCILSIRPDTVKYHLKNIYEKLNVTTRVQAISVAIERRLIN